MLQGIYLYYNERIFTKFQFDLKQIIELYTSFSISEIFDEYVDMALQNRLMPKRMTFRAPVLKKVTHSTIMAFQRIIYISVFIIITY